MLLLWCQQRLIFVSSYRAHSFGHILNKSHASACAFGPEKPSVVHTGQFVKFWMFCQKLTLLRLFPLKARAFLSDCPARFNGGQKWYQLINLPSIYQRFTLNFNFILPPSNSRKTIQRKLIRICSNCHCSG
jgi:hypothetical protein